MLFSLYNTYDYYALHKCENCYYLNDKLYVFSYKIIDDKVISPIKATYGGIEVLTDDTSIIYKSVDKILKDIIKNEIDEVEITFPPLYLYKNTQVIIDYLLNKGFKISNNNSHYIIDINKTPYTNKVNKGNRKRIKKCQEAGFEFKECSISDSYDLILKNRLEKEYNISMSKDDVFSMQNTFKDSVNTFAVYHGNTMVASSICYKLNEESVYVMFWGHLEKYNSYSPVAFLSMKLIEYYSKKEFKILDIGSVLTDQGINEGLKNFKERLGFHTSPKYTLTYKRV